MLCLPDGLPARPKHEPGPVTCRAGPRSCGPRAIYHGPKFSRPAPPLPLAPRARAHLPRHGLPSTPPHHSQHVEMSPPPPSSLERISFDRKTQLRRSPTGVFRSGRRRWTTPTTSSLARSSPTSPPPAPCLHAALTHRTSPSHWTTPMTTGAPLGHRSPPRLSFDSALTCCFNRIA
jgi:hypothetical protein